MKGLRELNRAFARADRTLKQEKDDTLRAAAEPVRADAERLAVQQISRIGMEWSRMRVGVTQRAVYVAPATRSTRVRSRKRPKFGTRLMEEAMVPALDRNRGQVVEKIDGLLRDVGRTWERG